MEHKHLEKKDITKDKEYDMRFSFLIDENFLLEVLKDPETVKWFPPSTESDVKIFARNWAGFSRYSASLTAIYGKETIGMATLFLMPYVKVAHLAMMYVVVEKKYRNRGVGRSLLKNINHLARTKFKLESLHVEIFEGCPLEHILPKAGYEKIVTQENFVELDHKMKARMIYEVNLLEGQDE